VLKLAPDNVRKRRFLPLTLVGLSLLISGSYVAHSGVLTLPFEQTQLMMVSPVDLPNAPPATYSDPLQRAVWVDGVNAVQRALAKPDYTNFGRSYVYVAAGNVVTFCGEVVGTSGYDSASGAQRFVSVFGQTQATMLEGNDPSFQVLWNRVCAQSANSI